MNAIRTNQKVDNKLASIALGLVLTTALAAFFVLPTLAQFSPTDDGDNGPSIYGYGYGWHGYSGGYGWNGYSGVTEGYGYGYYIGYGYGLGYGADLGAGPNGYRVDGGSLQSYGYGFGYSYGYGSFDACDEGDIPTDIYVDANWYFQPQVDADMGVDMLILGCDAFRDIQDAVNAADANQTIHVREGTYTTTEPIYVNTPGITITGPAGLDFEDQPLIEYVGTCEQIFLLDDGADDVTITGLNIDRDETYCDVPSFTPESLGNANIYIGSDNVTVSDTLNSGGFGVYAEPDTTGHVITQNQFFGNIIGVLLGSAAGGMDIAENQFGYGFMAGIFGVCGFDFGEEGYDPCGSSWSGMNVSNNEFFENFFTSIWLTGYEQTGTAKIGPGNVITDTYYGPGIWVMGLNGMDIDRNAIYENCWDCGNFIGLAYDGLYDNGYGYGYGYGNTLNATNNWWGYGSGPTIWSNPDGEGDGIEDDTEDPEATPGPTAVSRMTSAANRAPAGVRTAIAALMASARSLQPQALEYPGPTSGDAPEVLYNPWCTNEGCTRMFGQGGGSTGSIMPGSMLALQLGYTGAPGGSPAPTPTPSPEVGPSAPPPFLFTLFLSRGMSGPQVKALQEKLKTLGFFPADVDATGYFGPITEAAVKAFQKARGIDQVGFVGPRTRAALNM